MKQIRVNFFATASYRKIWIGFAFLAACLLAVFGWQMIQLQQQKQSLAEQINQLQFKRSQADAIKPSVVEPQYGPAFYKQASLAAQLLKTDLNKTFSTLENLKIPGARLQSLTLNAAQNLVEIEFELSQLSQASAISEALMAGYGQSPWRLMSTNALARASLIGASAASGYTARWQAKLDQL